jgi:hypothetical protein
MAEGTGEKIVTKAEFAALINVSRARVAQMIADGQIDERALEGAGRRARIRVETAKGQLRRRLHPGQRTGNGLGTRLDPGTIAPPAATKGERPPAPASNPRDAVDDAIRSERLQSLRNANRLAHEHELQRRGLYVKAAASRAAMTRLAGQIVGALEGGMAQIASAISAEFKLPQRDVLHLLSREFRAIRATATAQAHCSSEELPNLVDDELKEADAA